ncbi:lipopolysaccharide assembly protein LapA domain-containing protein [Salicola sp. Rm-C-2C1-2]|uniref:lipopolysaccharide assembly protein LapA domain-containing protein n=1 Tax=Salicola sp. Rm-C-2C1-2 TaxID=3141321 RepID=UPI0032E4C0CD
MARIRRIVLILLALVLGLAAMLFSFGNRQEVVLDLLLVQTPPVSVALVLVLTLIAGVILGAGAMLGPLLRARAGRRRAERQFRKSEKQSRGLQRNPAKSME